VCLACAVGTIQKLGSDYIALLVLGAFNAAIYQRDLSGQFKYDALV
jgi:hypothetical protein